MVTKVNRGLAVILIVAGVLCFVSAIVFAAEFNFVGTWKGEYSVSAPEPASDPASTAPAGRVGGSGGRTGGGFSSGPQKVTLRVKVNIEKPTGNFTMGTSPTEDIREGAIVGNKLMFKTGLAPATIYAYDAVLIGEDLSVTRTAEGGRGGKPQLFTLKRSK